MRRENRKPSKFFNKYRDRIDSIQTAEKKIKEKRRIEEEVNNLKIRKRGRKKKEEVGLLANQINKLNSNRKSVRKEIKEDKK